MCSAQHCSFPLHRLSNCPTECLNWLAKGQRVSARTRVQTQISAGAGMFLPVYMYPPSLAKVSDKLTLTLSGLSSPESPCRFLASPLVCCAPHMSHDFRLTAVSFPHLCPPKFAVFMTAHQVWTWLRAEFGLLALLASPWWRCCPNQAEACTRVRRWEQLVPAKNATDSNPEFSRIFQSE